MRVKNLYPNPRVLHWQYVIFIQYGQNAWRMVPKLPQIHQSMIRISQSFELEGFMEDAKNTYFHLERFPLPAH